MSGGSREAGRLTKAGLLMRLAMADPGEARDRVSNILEAWGDRRRPAPPYQVGGWGDLSRASEQALGRGFEVHLAEAGCQEIESEVLTSVTAPSRLPFRASHRADVLLARTCYAICRALKPAVVVETGVAYGVTSAFLLQAIALNGGGALHSVDLPPLAPDADRHVGSLVPARLRSAWTLHRGQTGRVLPALLDELGAVDMFVHDSLHTYRTMKLEFDLALGRLRRPGVILADDIQDNVAFGELVRNARPAHSNVLQEAGKESLFGVALFT